MGCWRSPQHELKQAPIVTIECDLGDDKQVSLDSKTGYPAGIVHLCVAWRCSSCFAQTDVSNVHTQSLGTAALACDASMTQWMV